LRRDPATVAIARKLHVTASPEIDRLYPQLRPARVKVTTPRGIFTRAADEALGSRLVPLDDAGLRAKFDALAGPVISPARAQALGEQIWAIETCADLRTLVEAALKPDDRGRTTEGR
jgi:2-methylcitrate dehydratase PrpD